MTVYGELIGCNLINSKKGTDCLFGFLKTNYDSNRESNGLGNKVIQFCSFGKEAASLYDQIRNDKLIGKTCEGVGLYNGSNFNIVQINSKK